MVNEEETRKGPWTEQEDVQLAFYVNLFGDRRWDFIAKVSGLKRTGKSCRLRWVNYMHPSLKRGKLSPQEEALVLQLHTKWGNRWSKIARKVPGRTDNDIKNYWRTHMRKEAQGKKKANMSSPSTTSLSSSSSSSGSPTGADSIPVITTSNATSIGADQCPKVYYSMDEIWKHIELPEEDKIINPVFHNFNEELGSSFSCTSTTTNNTTMITSIWDDNYYSNNTSLWSMDHQYYPEEGNVMMMPSAMTDHHQFDSFNMCS
ncbi:DNA-binding transcription factor [Lithospermum erythrorhizon]|uniref:DNA-binding transcription factor n=1 Tax=Lithospermum erythrorhizon TaxID=34254 RepID=A0AAV3QXZ2_LITER